MSDEIAAHPPLAPKHEAVQKLLLEAVGEPSEASVQDARTITRTLAQIYESAESSKAGVEAEAKLFVLVMEDLEERAKIAYLKFTGLDKVIQCEEVIGETFPRLQRALHAVQFKDRGHFFAVAFKNFTWVLLVAAEKATTLPINLDDTEGAGNPIDTADGKRIGAGTPEQPPSQPSKQKERYQDIWKACGALKDDQLKVIGLRHFGVPYLNIVGGLADDRMVFRQIADELKMETNEVYRIYQKALETIRRQLNEADE